MVSKQGRLIFLFITATLDMIGVGIIIPSLPDVVRRFVTEEGLVSEYFGYFISVYALMQFVASPLLGALSDFFGRRPVLLTSLFMAGIDYILMAFAPSLGWLFIGRVISGLTGASVTVCMAYIADISDDSNRSANYGLIGAAFGLGFIIGPALGGVLGNMGPEYPFLAAAILNLLNFLFGLFILPESFPKEKRHAVDLKRLNPLSTLKIILKSEVVLTFAIIHFLIQLAGLTHPSIWTIYSEHKFHWTPGEVGLSLTLVGLLLAISQGWLTRIVIPILGEYKTVLYSALGNVAGFAIFASVTTGFQAYLAIIFAAFFFVGQPALQSLATKSIPLDEQGTFQGSLVSLTSLASIINPVISTQLFSYFTDDGHPYIPGMPYYLAALISLVTWIVLMMKQKKMHQSTESLS